MSEKIVVDFAPMEGAVLRLLGLVERRGFRVSGLVMSEQPCGKRASLVLDVEPRDGNRSVDVLELQIRRLHGILGVTTASFAQGKAA